MGYTTNWPNLKITFSPLPWARSFLRASLRGQKRWGRRLRFLVLVVRLNRQSSRELPRGENRERCDGEPGDRKRVVWVVLSWKRGAEIQTTSRQT